MNDSLEMLNNINWFLSPVSQVLIFLFTTTKGIVISMLLVFTLLVFKLSDAVRVRKLANRAANKPPMPITEFSYITISTIAEIGYRIFANLPVLLITVLFLSGIVGFSASISSVNEFMENQTKIQEMQLVIKQLDANYKVATIEITNYDQEKEITSLTVSYFDNSINDYIDQQQNITIKGNDIYLLSKVINFDYSLIETENKQNIVLPIKIFSNKVPSSEGIKLNVADTNNVPYIFHKKEAGVYGMNHDTFNTRVKELFQIINNDSEARLNGIRSYYEAAPHTFVDLCKGQRFTIWVEQTGGVVMKQETDF